MRGFFKDRKPGIGSVPQCSKCGMCKSVRTPMMKPHGGFRSGILCVGEAPGEVEDERGLPWQGRMGGVLRRAFTELGTDLFEDCLNTNSCSCRPVGEDGYNRTPVSKEVGYCRPLVMKTMAERKPKVVILFGHTAVTSVIGHRWKKDLGTISKWRGWAIPDRDFNCWLCPTFHPSHIERQQDNLELRTLWIQDLKHALSMADTPFPIFEDESKQVEIVTDLRFLADLRSPAAVDFETTGLKPHAKGHRIVCASVCDRPDRAWAFMMPERGSRDWLRFRNWMESEQWEKIASNIKFEDTWSHNIMSVRPARWHWDTMLAAHVLDNRPDINSIKFQAYVQLGVVDYASEVDPFLKGVDQKNGNSFNRIDELVKTETGRRKLMTYCGQDSLYEYKVAMIQQERLSFK